MFSRSFKSCLTLRSAIICLGSDVESSRDSFKFADLPVFVDSPPDVVEDFAYFDSVSMSTIFSVDILFFDSVFFYKELYFTGRFFLSFEFN